MGHPQQPRPQWQRWSVLAVPSPFWIANHLRQQVMHAAGKAQWNFISTNSCRFMPRFCKFVYRRNGGSGALAPAFVTVAVAVAAVTAVLLTAQSPNGLDHRPAARILPCSSHSHSHSQGLAATVIIWTAVATARRASASCTPAAAAGSRVEGHARAGGGDTSCGYSAPEQRPIDLRTSAADDVVPQCLSDASTILP